MRHKTLDAAATFKAVEGEDPGTFTAVVSVFGNVDRAGDVISKGAFTETLEKGLPPVIWSHQWLTPPVGKTISAVETEEGLEVKGVLFVEEVELARHIWTAMKAGALNEWSVGLNVKSERFEDQDGRKITILEKLDLIEYGPCLKGVNELTRTIDVKSAELLDAETRARTPEPEAEKPEQELDSAKAEPTPEQLRALAALLF